MCCWKAEHKLSMLLNWAVQIQHDAGLPCPLIASRGNHGPNSRDQQGLRAPRCPNCNSRVTCRSSSRTICNKHASNPLPATTCMQCQSKRIVHNISQRSRGVHVFPRLNSLCYYLKLLCPVSPIKTTTESQGRRHSNNLQEHGSLYPTRLHHRARRHPPCHHSRRHPPCHNQCPLPLALPPTGPRRHHTCHLCMCKGAMHVCLYLVCKNLPTQPKTI